MHLVWEALTVQTPRGRLALFCSISLLVFCVPYRWLAHLSLWQAIGWKTAPSIGLTRAYWLLLHGDPVAAWHRNWLIYPVLLVWLGIFSWDSYQVIMRQAEKA